MNFPRQRAPVSTETVRTDDLYPLTGTEIDVHGDLNIGANKIKTTNLLIKEGDASFIYIRDTADTAFRNIRVGTCYASIAVVLGGDATMHSSSLDPTVAWRITAQDGTAYRTVFKFVNTQAEWYSWDGSAEQLVAKGNAGYLELARARLTGDLDFNSYKIVGLYRDVDDYGGNFTNYTPPTGAEGMIILAVDTNSTNPGQRIYVYVNGDWHYVDLT